jgi:hypothetical protein
VRLQSAYVMRRDDTVDLSLHPAGAEVGRLHDEEGESGQLPLTFLSTSFSCIDSLFCKMCGTVWKYITSQSEGCGPFCRHCRCILPRLACFGVTSKASGSSAV